MTKSKPTKDRKEKKGGWNYRILVVREADELVFNIHEVYYDEKTDEPTSWSAEPIYAQGDNIANLMDDLHMMTNAMYAPVLEAVNGKLVEHKMSITQRKL